MGRDRCSDSWQCTHTQRIVYGQGLAGSFSRWRVLATAASSQSTFESQAVIYCEQHALVCAVTLWKIHTTEQGALKHLVHRGASRLSNNCIQLRFVADRGAEATAATIVICSGTLVRSDRPHRLLSRLHNGSWYVVDESAAGQGIAGTVQPAGDCEKTGTV